MVETLETDLLYGGVVYPEPGFVFEGLESPGGCSSRLLRKGKYRNFLETVWTELPRESDFS